MQENVGSCMSTQHVEQCDIASVILPEHDSTRIRNTQHIGQYVRRLHLQREDRPLPPRRPLLPSTFYPLLLLLLDKYLLPTTCYCS